MNILTNKSNNRSVKFESYWRRNVNDTHIVDSHGVAFPFPVKNNPWSDRIHFLNRLTYVQNIIASLKSNKYIFPKSPEKCYMCNKTNIDVLDYKYSNIVWNSGLAHYIEMHNIKPSDEFIEFIYNFGNKKNTKNIKLNGTLYKIDDLKYIKFDRNQILILDALLNHGGQTKKYYDKVNNIYRFSEHSGLIDFNSSDVDKIIISGKSGRVDEDDDEIFLPKNIPEAFDYEYIFHTHPPTPSPGSRVDVGILYEFPSTNDVLHFIEHYNHGETQGSLVITPEGLYNIRTYSLNNKTLNINENKLKKELTDAQRSAQISAIRKYTTKFTKNDFYLHIAQDYTYINMINKTLIKYGLYIDYFPRTLSSNNTWIIDTIHLPIYVVEPAK